MLIKFLPHGSGSARKAADYLSAERDHKGEIRAGNEVIRGDLELTAITADSLDYKWRYSSAVIAWSKEDNPSREQIDAVLDDFDRVAFAGMEQDEYSRAAVLHTEADGSKHIHILIARCDLATGRSFNAAPPGWQRHFAPVKDHHNALNGWASPDDPALARAINTAAPQSLDQKEAKQQIHSWIESRILAGEIESRADVIASLKEIGEITRQGKDYVSVKPQGFNKAVRLKEGIYAERFSSEVAADIEAEKGRGSEPVREPDPASARRARRAIEAAIERRASDFAKTHRGPDRPTWAADREPNEAGSIRIVGGPEEGQSPEDDRRRGMDENGLGRHRPGGRAGVRDGHADALPIGRDQIESGDAGSAARDAGDSPGAGSDQQRSGPVPGPSRRQQASPTERRQDGNPLARLIEYMESQYERIRTAITDRIRAAYEAAAGAEQESRRADDAARRRNAETRRASGHIAESNWELDEAIGRLERNFGALVARIGLDSARDLERMDAKNWNDQPSSVQPQPLDRRTEPPRMT